MSATSLYCSSPFKPSLTFARIVSEFALAWSRAIEYKLSSFASSKLLETTSARLCPSSTVALSDFGVYVYSCVPCALAITVPTCVCSDELSPLVSAPAATSTLSILSLCVGMLIVSPAFICVFLRFSKLVSPLVSLSLSVTY